MAQAKIYEVKHTRKDQGICGKCGEELKKGGPYRWWAMGFRTGARGKRCMKPECTPTRAERESSMLSELYAHQDGFKAEEYDNAEDLEAAMREVIDVCLDLAERYKAAGTNQLGVEWRPEFIERGDNLEAVENDKPELDTEPNEDETEEEWLDRIRNDAQEFIDGISAE